MNQTSLATADGAEWSVTASDGSVGPLRAQVPGCVHTDLLRAEAIPDPFVDTNENEVQWVGRTDWTYTCRFDAAPAADNEQVDLVFEGLDTIATLTLNGVVLGAIENMHRTFRFDVGDHLVTGTNELEIKFSSAELAAHQRREEYGHLPTASFDQPYQFVRKMACAWGWDWGPTLNTAGVWRDAYLQRWQGARIAACRPTATVDDQDSGADEGTVSVAIDLEWQSEQAQATQRIRARLLDPQGSQLADTEIEVAPGTPTANLALNPGRVELWWPHTLGDQPLYELHVDLIGATTDVTEVAETVTRRIGFRTIELDTSQDELGSRFTIQVNGIDMFARGLNWIPDDPLPVRVDRDRYRSRVEDFVALNADVLRIWGGGIYESDHLYEACDELGVLVWQDFLFACAAYPEDLLQTEIEAEAKDNINRLMSHPSLAIWNGNNENFMGWFEWGWPEKVAGRTWGESFYLDLLPKLTDELDPARPYWPGSPYSGSMTVSTTADAQGCSHLWEVWNRVDYLRYRSNVPRFVSEFGWQAPPTRRTIDRFITETPLTPDSPAMLHHQKAVDGQDKLRRGLAPFFDEPSEVGDWIWAMQLNQTRAITTGIEHFRANRGVCMGTLWWQFNDCWPVTSWAVLDSEGGQKPAYHAMRDVYRDRLVTLQPRGSGLIVALVNETGTPWQGPLVIRRRHFDGTIVGEHQVEVAVGARDSTWVGVPTELGLPGESASELVTADFGEDRAIWFFDADKSLALEPAKISCGDPAGTDDHMTVQVTAHNLVRDLSPFVDALGPTARVDRQLITLLPGESALFELTAAGSDSPKEVMEMLKFRSANDLVAGSPTIVVAPGEHVVSGL